MGGRPKRSNPNHVIPRGFPFAPDLAFRFPPLLLPLPGFECKESVSPSEESARRPCSSSGRVRRMRLVVWSYSSGRSSSDVELDVDRCVNYQTKKRGEGRACMNPMKFGLHLSMRWVLSFGRRACWIWKWTEIWRGCDSNHCNAIVSPPLKGRVVIDQGSAESGVRLIC